MINGSEWKETKLYYSLQFIAILDVIAIVSMHLRIEFYKMKEYTPILGENPPILGSYTLKTLRRIFGFLIIFSAFVLSRLFITDFRNGITKLIMHFCLTNFIPSVMILNNEKMWNFTKKKFFWNNNVVHSSPSQI